MSSVDDVTELLDLLSELGVTEHTIYQHLLNYFPANYIAEALEDLRIEVTDADITVADAIDAMTYSMYDNYRNDPDATYDLILEVIVEHLEDPDLYALREGVDFTRSDVANEMAKYDWGDINEDRSVGRWMHEANL